LLHSQRCRDCKLSGAHERILLVGDECVACFGRSKELRVRLWSWSCYCGDLFVHVVVVPKLNEWSEFLMAINIILRPVLTDWHWHYGVNVSWQEPYNQFVTQDSQGGHWESKDRPVNANDLKIRPSDEIIETTLIAF
jgi:hypothetical protein